MDSETIVQDDDVIGGGAEGGGAEGGGSEGGGSELGDMITDDDESQGLGTQSSVGSHGQDYRVSFLR